MDDEEVGANAEGVMEVDGEVKVVEEEWEEEERTWRCPRAITFMQTVRKWRKDKVAVFEVSQLRVCTCVLH